MGFLAEFEASEKQGKNSFLAEFEAEDSKPEKPKAASRLDEMPVMVNGVDTGEVYDAKDRTKAARAANSFFSGSVAYGADGKTPVKNIGFKDNHKFETPVETLKSGAKIVDGLSGIAEVGLRKGYAGLGRTEAGAVKILSDILSNTPLETPLSNFSNNQLDYADKIENGVILNSSPIKGFSGDSIVQKLPKTAVNAIGSVITTAPSLVAGAVAPELTFPSMFATAGMQEYGEGRKKLNPFGAAFRAIPQSALEVIGEKIGGSGQLTGALNNALKGNGLTKLGSAMVSSGLKEIPGEEFTTTGQFLADKSPGIGLNQEAGLDDYIQQVKDTALTTLLQSGAMTAGGSVLNSISGNNAESPPTIPQPQPTPPAATQPQAAPQSDIESVLSALNKANELTKKNNGEAQAQQQTPNITREVAQASPSAEPLVNTSAYDDLLAEVNNEQSNNQDVSAIDTLPANEVKPADPISTPEQVQTVDTPTDSNIEAEQLSTNNENIISNKPKKPAKKAGTLLATLKGLGGVKLSEKLDVTGEDKRFAPGGYNQVFSNKSRASLKGLIESGSLDDYLPHNMRLESNGMNDGAFDSTEAYDYIAEKIRNGEKVIEFDIDQEIKANKYYQEDSADSQRDISNKVLSDSEINAILREASYDDREREADTQDQVFEQGGSSSDIDGNAGIQAGAGTGTQSRGITETQTNAVTRSEVSDARDIVTQIVKRRAAANQIGKSKPFDTALQLAKDFMSGESVNPNKFKNAAILFKNDPLLSEQFSQLHSLAKTPNKEARAEILNVVELFKQQITAAKDSQSLHGIARGIQEEDGLTDAQMQALDGAVMARIDARDGGLEVATQATEYAQESSNQDLLGDNTSKQQAIADAERAKDAKRNSGTDNQSGFTLTGSNSEADKAAAHGAQTLFSRSNSSEFVKSPSGSIDFGEITPDMAKAMRRQAGKIRLEYGNSEYGLKHIESRHGDQIRSIGFDSAQSFIADALKHIDSIWKPSKTSQLVVVQSTEKGKAVFIQLKPSENGDFYTVNTAFPVRDNFVDKKDGWSSLWSRVPVSADASGTSLFADQLTKASEAIPMESNQSDSATLLSNNDDVNLSRDTEKQAGITKQQFTDTLAKEFGKGVADSLISNGVIVPLADQSKLPAHVVPYLRDGDIVFGFYDPKTNRTYAVLENLDADMVRGLTLHEVGTHYGLENMLGKNKYGNVIKRMQSMRKEGNREVLKAYKEAEANAVNDGQVQEEAVAYLVQNSPKLDLVRRIIAEIKAWLFNKFGIGADGLTDTDIAMLAKAAVNYSARDSVNAKTKPERSFTELSAAFQRTNKDAQSQQAQDDKSFTDFDFVSKLLPKEVPLLYQRDAKGNIQLTAGKRLADLIDTVARPIAIKAGMARAPMEFRKLAQRQKADLEKAMKVAGNVVETSKGMSDKERALIGRLVTKELEDGDVPPEYLYKMAAIVEQTLTQQGKDLVELGFLSKETQEKWQGQYLPRLYSKDLDSEIKKTLWQRMARRSNAVDGLRSGSHKGRGKRNVVAVAELPQWEALGWQVDDSQYKKNAQGMLALEKDGKQVPDATLVKIWKDYTKDERKQMGEIDDFLPRFVTGYIDMQKDIALGRLYQSIASNPDWVRRTESDGYVYVPVSEIPDTGGLKRFGSLSGLYVKKEIYDSIQHNESESNEFLKVYKEALSKWKETKTVLNPTTHMNNIASNLTMAHFAGVSYWDVEKYAMAVHDFVKKDGYIQEAIDGGLFAGGISYDELNRNMPQSVRNLLSQYKDSKARKGARMIFNALALGQRENMANAYQFEDSFFKYIIYRDARNKGMSSEDAIQDAQDFIFNYDDLPKTARAIRDYGIPFFSWTYKSIPKLVDTALKYPWRFAAPATAIAAANALVYAALAGDDDDWWWLTAIKDGSMNAILNAYTLGMYGESKAVTKGQQLEQDERKSLPEWDAGRSAIGTHKTIRRPNDKESGLPVFQNMYRMIPGGDLFDVTNERGGLSIPAPFMPSSPVVSIITDLIANKDFRGKELIGKHDTATEKGKKLAKWTWQFSTPAIAPFNRHYDRLAEMVAHEFDMQIKSPFPFDDYTGVGNDGLAVKAKYAIPQTFGIKAREVDLDKSEDISESVDNSDIKLLVKEIRSAAYKLDSKQISQREYDNIEKSNTEKIERIENNQ